MSHRATNWAIQQRGLKPATKLVLWYLADRHNPDHGCFPSQAQLAEDAEMSVSSLNDHLEKLEQAGLIRRQRRIDTHTRKQMSTRYILGFEPEVTQEPTPKNGDGKTEKPSPKNGDSRLRNSETNLVREPVNTTTDFNPETVEPGSVCLNACGPGLSEYSRGVIRDTDDVIDGWLDAGLELDLDIVPVLRSRTQEANQRVIRTWDYFSQAVWSAHARRMARVARSDCAENGASEIRGDQTADGVKVDPLVRLANWINSQAYVPVSACTNLMRDEMLARGLVTRERLRQRGIY
jgi:hypothetical protein